MRKLRSWVKIALFLSSYIPLYLIIIARNWWTTVEVGRYTIPWIAVFFVALTIFSGYALRKVLSLRRSEEPKPRDIDSYRRKNDLLTNYLVAYIVPFANIDLTTIGGWAALLVFFFVLASIQINSDQLYTNPVLALIGYDIYEIDDSDGRSSDLIVIKRNENISGQSIDVVQISDNIYLSV